MYAIKKRRFSMGAMQLLDSLKKFYETNANK